QQRFQHGDPSNRPAGSVGMTVRVSRRDSKEQRPRGLALSAIPSEWNESRDLQPGIPATNENKPPPCSQKVIRRQSEGNTEQLAVGASRPVDGMRRNQRLSPALRWGPGAAAPGREGVLKG